MDDTPETPAQPAPDEQPAMPAENQPAPDSPPADPVPASEPIWTALVDGTGLLTGFDETGQAEGVSVPVGCDLLPGKYRWDGKSWQPMLQAFDSKEISAPEDRSAIALALIAIRDGKPMPPYSMAWLAIFEKTFDAKGNA